MIEFVIGLLVCMALATFIGGEGELATYPCLAAKSSFDIKCLKCNETKIIKSKTALDAVCDGEIEHFMESGCRGSLVLVPKEIPKTELKELPKVIKAEVVEPKRYASSRNYIFATHFAANPLNRTFRHLKTNAVYDEVTLELLTDSQLYELACIDKQSVIKV